MLKAYETSGNVLFEEIQKYPKWIYYLVCGILLFVLVILIIASYYSDEEVQGLWLGIVIVVITGILVVYLMQKIQFEKIVTTNGFYYRWRWWQKKYRCIEKENIEAFEVRRFPLLSYGFGWFPGYGWYHNVSSGDGIQLYLKNGGRYYFSTSDITSLKAALNKLVNPAEKNRFE
jgi:hypothetical protein